MVVRSARRAIDAGCFSRVVVATEDAAIVEVCREHGIPGILTPRFPTGTDRVAWACEQMGSTWVVNLQGDEPVFPLDLLRELVLRIPQDPHSLWTAADTALESEAWLDPDVVKIALGEACPGPSGALPCRYATDFHRARHPGSDLGFWGVHVGIYAGSRTALTRFAALPQSSRERARSIEPLRALDAGMGVKALVGKWNRVAVDRLEHISRVMDEMPKAGE